MWDKKRSFSCSLYFLYINQASARLVPYWWFTFHTSNDIMAITKTASTWSYCKIGNKHFVWQITKFTKLDYIIYDITIAPLFFFCRRFHWIDCGRNKWLISAWLTYKAQRPVTVFHIDVNQIWCNSRIPLLFMAYHQLLRNHPHMPEKGIGLIIDI